MLSKVFLEITNTCNLSCSFCHGTSRPPRSLTAEEFDVLTDKIKGKAQYLYFHVLGEPLTHSLLPEFINIAAAKGFRPMLTTNGTLLDSRADELIKSRIYKISISLHALEANGEYAPSAYLNSCIAFADKASLSGIITVFRLWNIGGRNSANAEILNTLHAAFPDDWHENRSGYRIRDKLYLEWGEKFDWPDAAGEVLGEDAFCYALRDQIAVLSDGTVVPCCLDANGSIALGNLFEDDLEAILNSPRAQSIYTGFTRHKAIEPLCRSCGYALKTKQYRE